MCGRSDSNIYINCLKFSTFICRWDSIVCGTNNHVKSEMLSNRHRQTHRPSIVTLAVHARWGLNISLPTYSLLHMHSCTARGHRSHTYIPLAWEGNVQLAGTCVVHAMLVTQFRYSHKLHALARLHASNFRWLLNWTYSVSQYAFFSCSAALYFTSWYYYCCMITCLETLSLWFLPLYTTPSDNCVWWEPK